MPRGGPRPGAGRKKGSATEKTREVADRIAKGGITPLDVMNEVMLRHYRENDYDKAAAVARDLAPYVHPRLSAVSLDAAVNVANEFRFELVVVDAGESPTCTPAPNAASIPPK